MNDLRKSVSELLEERPETENALVELLEIDEEGAWTFHDTDLDSGTFGEIVSRGIVEECDGGYRITDPDVVRVALGQERAESEAKDTLIEFPSLSVSLDHLRSKEVWLLAGALLFVLLVRTVPISDSVFRPGNVVLTGNDPYFYRYWIDQLLENGYSAFDPVSLTKLPEGVTGHDTLTIVILWWVGALFGGSTRTAGMVLAWYPVLAALITTVFVYGITKRVTNDKRTGLGAAFIFATIPAHAYRTSLGFADHHAFDYVWLAMTTYLLLVILTKEVKEIHRPKTAFAVLGFGLGIAGQTASWRAGPLLYMPVGLIVFLNILSGLRTRNRPVTENGLVLAGLAVAAASSILLNFGLGWLPPYRWLAPTLLFAGTAGILIIGELAYRLEWSLLLTSLGSIFTTVTVFTVTWVTVPQFNYAVPELIQYLQQTSDSGIAETLGLFSGQIGSIAGPLLIFGLALFLALPYAAIAGQRAIEKHRPKLLIPLVFTGFFLTLALLQVRFSGELSLFVAVFAGIGFIHLAAAVDLLDSATLFADDSSENSSDGRARIQRIPSRQIIINFCILFLLVSGLGIVQSAVKMNQLAVDEDDYQVATWINDHAGAADREYPENYVLTPWGQNRVYNYIVSGESRSYAFAQENYGEFLADDSVGGWYERFDGRVGYILTEDQSSPFAPDTMQARLHGRDGSYGEGSTGSGHYRTVHIRNGSNQKVVSVVPGALVTGTTDANATVKSSTNDTVSGSMITYERRTTATMDGNAAIRVAYPGKYQIGNEEVTVTEADVTQGGFVTDADGVGHWKLNEGRGTVLFDEQGGDHGFVTNGTWTDGIRGRGLAFDDDTVGRLPSFATVDPKSGFSLSIWFRTQTGIDYINDRVFPRLLSTAPRSLYRKTSGIQLGLVRSKLRVGIGNGDKATLVTGPSVADERWHQAAVTYNGSHLSLFLDGQLVNSTMYDGTIPGNESLYIGTTSGGRNHFPGTVDSVRVEPEAVPESEIADWNANLTGS